MAITTLGHIGAGHISTVHAMDQAFADAACHLIAANGTVRLLDVHQWRAEADGNDLRLFVDQCRGATLDIGCGPGRLLRRAADLVRPGGEIIAEVDPEGTGVIREHVHLRVGERVTAPFAWASVGIDCFDAVATAAGLVVVATQSVGHRHTAALRRAIW